jgi:uncharacterized protein (TIGR00251 family)
MDIATIAVRVIPRAGRTAIAGWRGEALLVRLAAAPVDGAANDALVAFIARLLGCARRDIAIVSGAQSRDKRLRIAGFTHEDVHRRMSELAANH